MRPLSEGHSQAERYLRTDFLAALAHAIRSPLGVASGALGELSEAPPEEREFLLAMAARNLRRLEALADALGRVAEVEKGSVQPVLAGCDVTQVARQSVAGKANDRVELREDLPGAALRARTDPELLGRILSLLLDNALRFASAVVTLRAGAEEDRVYVEVEDDGAGIAAERRERLCNRFVSARERGAHSDLALGLSLVRDYASLLDARVDISHGNNGRGTRVRVQMPRAGPSEGSG